MKLNYKTNMQTMATIKDVIDNNTKSEKVTQLYDWIGTWKISDRNHLTQDRKKC